MEEGRKGDRKGEGREKKGGRKGGMETGREEEREGRNGSNWPKLYFSPICFLNGKSSRYPLKTL